MTKRKKAKFRVGERVTISATIRTVSKSALMVEFDKGWRSLILVSKDTVDLARERRTHRRGRK